MRKTNYNINYNIKDEIATCRMCVTLWEAIAKKRDYPIGVDIFDLKEELCEELFGIRFMYGCPCCEFAIKLSFSPFTNCNKCPMNGFFTKFGDYSCEDGGSPYRHWVIAMQPIRDGAVKKDRQYHLDAVEREAWKMAQIANEALEYWTGMKDMNITW